VVVGITDRYESASAVTGLCMLACAVTLTLHALMCRLRSHNVETCQLWKSCVAEQGNEWLQNVTGDGRWFRPYDP
jgi:hypothetical protein